MFGQWVVMVDSNNDFQITGALSYGNSGPQIATTIAEVSVAATLNLINNQSLWLWSDSLGGDVVYLHNDVTAANARSVTFYAQEMVSPTEYQHGIYQSGITASQHYR